MLIPCLYHDELDPRDRVVEAYCNSDPSITLLQSTILSNAKHWPVNLPSHRRKRSAGLGGKIQQDKILDKFRGRNRIKGLLSASLAG